MSAHAPAEGQHPTGWREIRHYAYAERPFDAVWAILARSPALALGGGTPGGASGAEASLHARRAGVDVAREVRLRFGGMVLDNQRARLSLRWEDAHHPRLFPVLEAVLEVAPLRSGRHQVTQVGVVGRYRPPFGVIGALGDRLAGEAVAGESVARYVEALARRLEELVPAAAEPAEDARLASVPADPSLRRAFIPVERLDDRPGGAASVGRYLESAPGVVWAEVHPLAGLAAVDFDPELCNPIELLEQLEDDREWFRDGGVEAPSPVPGSDV